MPHYVRFGNGRASPLKMNPLPLSPIAHELRSQKISYGSLWGIWCKPQTGRESSRSESLFEVNERNRKSKSRCSSKAIRHGGLRLVRFVLQSKLAQFTLHSSRHVLGCVNFALVPPNMFGCIPHVYHTRERVLCGCTLWRHRESCRSGQRTRKGTGCLSMELAPMKTIKWKRAKPARRFCLRLVHVQINPRAIILIAFNNMLFILTFRVLFAIFFVLKRFCVSCHLTHLHV